jgi:hypothetical protein
MLLTISSKRGNSAIESQRTNVDRSNNAERCFDSLPTHSLQLCCDISSSKPTLKPQQFKLKKRTVKEKLNVQESLTDKIGIPEDILQQSTSISFSPIPSFSPPANPCDHILNVSPLSYGGSVRGPSFSMRSSPTRDRDLLLQRGNIKPRKYSGRETFIQSDHRHITTTQSSANGANLTTGLGCLPKGERVSAAPNSKANSYIYKNEYRSLIVSADLNRMATLQKSKESVASTNSPSRLRELMKSEPRSSIMKLFSARFPRLHSLSLHRKVMFFSGSIHHHHNKKVVILCSNNFGICKKVQKFL